jgi:hypothetical protein
MAQDCFGLSAARAISSYAQVSRSFVRRLGELKLPNPGGAWRVGYKNSISKLD